MSFSSRRCAHAACSCRKNNRHFHRVPSRPLVAFLSGSRTPRRGHRSTRRRPEGRNLDIRVHEPGRSGPTSSPCHGAASSDRRAAERSCREPPQAILGQAVREDVRSWRSAPDRLAAAEVWSRLRRHAAVPDVPVELPAPIHLLPHHDVLAVIEMGAIRPCDHIRAPHLDRRFAEVLHLAHLQLGL